MRATPLTRDKLRKEKLPEGKVWNAASHDCLSVVVAQSFPGCNSRQTGWPLSSDEPGAWNRISAKQQTLENPGGDL